MTPEERADHALGEVSLDDDEERGFATGRVADAIRKAAVEERKAVVEACAKIAERSRWVFGKEIAADIRRWMRHATAPELDDTVTKESGMAEDRSCNVHGNCARENCDRCRYHTFLTDFGDLWVCYFCSTSVEPYGSDERYLHNQICHTANALVDAIAFAGNSGPKAILDHLARNAEAE